MKNGHRAMYTDNEKYDINDYSQFNCNDHISVPRPTFNKRNLRASTPRQGLFDATPRDWHFIPRAERRASVTYLLYIFGRCLKKQLVREHFLYA